jgi:hypothetical protein
VARPAVSSATAVKPDTFFSMLSLLLSMRSIAPLVAHSEQRGASELWFLEAGLN